jgi:nucleotidyltransferase/DNA polymerase involved in DNA repair
LGKVPTTHLTIRMGGHAMAMWRIPRQWTAAPWLARSALHRHPAASPGENCGVTRWVLHVDMDQFIAAVELLRRPELRGRPVVVGGDGDPTKRGVVSTASYEAREYGVHSGMPLRTAARRCPEAVFLAVDRELYEAASAKVMATLQELDAVVEVLGWDEAFLAIDTEDPEASALEIQQRVRAATDLDCSVGIGQNKLQAKMATGFGKPAGVFRLTNESWFEVLGERRTDVLWGIGSKTAKRLGALGISTVLELSQADPQTLAAAVGPTTGPWLITLAQGRGSTTVVSAPYIARSHSRETTFQQDLEDWEQVCREVAILSRRVAEDVTDGRRAVRVVVKVRYAPFTTRTHGRALTAPSSDAEAIQQAALAALDAFTSRAPVRLLGVRAELET